MTALLRAKLSWRLDGAASHAPHRTPFHARARGATCETQEVKGNTNYPEWKERPGTACVRYDKTGDTVTVIDAASGQIRGKIVKPAAGNAAKLAP